MSARCRIIASTGNIELKSSIAHKHQPVRRGQLITDTKGLWSAECPSRAGVEVVDPSRGAESGMLQGLIVRAAGRLMLDRFQDPASMRSLIDKSRKDIESNAGITRDAGGLLTMMSSLESFGWPILVRPKPQAGQAAGETMPELRWRIETLDVTRDLRQQEALVRQVRSKWDISFPQSNDVGVLACGRVCDHAGTRA
jgi:hypothetical protein